MVSTAPTEGYSSDVTPSRRIVEGFYVSTKEAGVRWWYQLEAKVPTASMVRDWSQPMFNTLSNKVPTDTLVERADAVLDQILNAKALLTAIVIAVRDVLLGLLSGLFSRAPCPPPAGDLAEETPPPESMPNTFRSRIDAVFYWPVKILSPKTDFAASVDGNEASYAYSIGWECGSWVVERGCQYYGSVASSFAPEINVAELGETLARMIPRREPWSRLVCQRRSQKKAM